MVPNVHRNPKAYGGGGGGGGIIYLLLTPYPPE